MDIIDGQLVLSPRDLIAELECSHRLLLDFAVKTFHLEAPAVESSPELKLLEALGRQHEARIVEALRLEGNVKLIDKPALSRDAIASASQQTRDAIASGVDTIVQACLFTGDFVGYPDFLVLAKDSNGAAIKDSQQRFVYNPVDAKSARSEKRGAVLQVAAYAHALREMGLATPTYVHLWLGGDKEWKWPADDLMDLAEEFVERAHARISQERSIPTQLWEAPRESCIRCRWIKNCESGRIEADDISLTQGIRASTRVALVQSGVLTMTQLANATPEQRPRTPKEISEETFKTLVAQANLQVRGRSNKSVILNEPKELLALGLMPPHSRGDIWFDMEGDPFAENGDGLEYMFGYTFLDSNETTGFKTFDALDRASEKVAFAKFVEMVLNRQGQFPDMHIYHYAAYEPSRLGILSQRHGILEREVDQLLRSGAFVDLYSIVRKAFRFSSDSMSIKDVEQVYQGKRTKDEGVSTAIESVIQFEAAISYLQLGDQRKFNEILDTIRLYNKVDCDSTRQLDLWLRGKALEFNVDIIAIRSSALEAYSDVEEVIDPVADQLLNGIPTDSSQRTVDQQGIALLASAVSFHWREAKPVWWSIFDRAKAALDDFAGFNDVVLASDVRATGWSTPPGKRNLFRTITMRAEGVEINHIIEERDEPHLLYENAPTGFKQIHGSPRGIKLASRVISISGDIIEVEESVKNAPWTDMPIALLPGKPIPAKPIPEVLRDGLGVSILARKNSPGPTFPDVAWADLLLKREPRQMGGQPLRHTENQINDIVYSLEQSKDSYVAVQGPPGTGKTYVGKHVIAQLAARGWKIGVSAQSHAVIENILDGVLEVNASVHIAKKERRGDQATKSYHTSDVEVWARQQAAGYVIGGTAWTFSSAKVRALGLDLMVVDEAGQFSLANTLAVVSSARRALILGDPQQLPQVSQATHPEPIEISVLSHLMGDQKTIPDAIGYFLEMTHRMHPKITSAVSKLQYENRLHSHPVCSERFLSDVEPGLHIVEVEHEGNTVKSEEEAAEILRRIPEILGKQWTDQLGAGQEKTIRPIAQNDILIVAAYNRQVRYIKTLLTRNNYHNIRVGTVDKFQGQEAPVVFVSMATSSSEDLPRGVEFLLSPNRLNVAISRAKWACYLLRSPQLSKMEPASAMGMVYLGKFVSLCKQLAEDWDPRLINPFRQ